MDIAAIMVEIGEKLKTIPELNVKPWNPDGVTVPAAFVSLPEQIDFEQSYNRGRDTMVLEVLVLVSRSDAENGRDMIAAYAKGSGPRSIREKLDYSGQNLYNSCGDVTVTGAQFLAAEMSGTNYLAAVFRLEIEGSGD